MSAHGTGPTHRSAPTAGGGNSIGRGGARIACYIIALVAKSIFPGNSSSSERSLHSPQLGSAKSRLEPSTLSTERLREILDRVSTQSQRHGAALAAELLALPLSLARERLDELPRPAGAGLAAALLREARSLLGRSAPIAARAAELAWWEVEHLVDDPEEGFLGIDFAAEAAALAAEALLLCGRREEARRHLTVARLLAAHSVADPLVLGEVMMAQALHAWTEKRLPGALRHLDGAASIFRDVGEPRRELLAWLRRAFVAKDAGRFEEAREALGAARALAREVRPELDLGHAIEALESDLERLSGGTRSTSSRPT